MKFIQKLFAFDPKKIHSDWRVRILKYLLPKLYERWDKENKAELKILNFIVVLFFSPFVYLFSPHPHYPQ